ncbi:hypothetical protein K2173_011514 [Erythroxylum novogranatense]|uniref:Vacuolar protein sorting-associated protein 62 n=1 Tax=Erythroxylum novogranatense TaxID=1862640 RepID=A0AAV8TVU6_9ROSI|nr:hypothetical protein K2173_011514 [Erythroxylum novogranatense]
MFACEWFCCNQAPDLNLPELDPEPFSLPSPLPSWPPGEGFATGRINLGDVEVIQVTQFEIVWSCKLSQGKTEVVTFYRPVGFPDGFYCLGYYCQPDSQPLRGYVLVARDTNATKPADDSVQDLKSDSPALTKPLNYTMIWSTDSHYEGSGYFWRPNPPEGYKAMGIVVTNCPEEPDIDHVRCVRADLTERCETSDLITSVDPKSTKRPFQVWSTKPCRTGMYAKGVPVGTFYCSNDLSSEEALLDTACLKNLDNNLGAMPNLDQIHTLIKQYGPTVYFHPDEVYMPSSVQWFFKNGALLYEDGKQQGEPINYMGSNLPSGGESDGEYWIDLPTSDDARNFVKRGHLESAELYVHIKPALGGTFTDMAMWVFCPFNGPATVKVGIMSIQMAKIGQHVGDWEHFTLRVSNFTGELWQVFFSQHSGGKWVDASELEFIEGNRPIVYSSKHGHASFPYAGTYLQGSTKLGVGVRNDTARSKYYVDSSTQYQLIAAEHLGDGIVKEPCWLQYMREWGPTTVYDGRAEIEKIIGHLPFFVRFSLENIFDLFPTELYGEEGPTGPKEKDNWIGDEIC